MSETQQDVERRYRMALDSFVAKVQQDSYIIAAILCGSLSHDTVWAKSDIDIVLIGRDEKRPFRAYNLVEEGVNIHVSLYARSRFKRDLEQALQSSFLASYISKSRLLFSSDPSLTEYYAGLQGLGAADRERALLLGTLEVLPALPKAEKWLVVKRDPAYSFLWLMYLLSSLARIEVALHGEIAGREVVQQAMHHNPALFRALYFDLIDRPKDKATMREVLDLVNAYLVQHTPVLFRPLLDYLAQAGGPRSATEINEYFRNRLQVENVGNACEWLAEQGVIQQLATPLRLTEKSRVTVDEAAYYYENFAP